MVPKPKRHALSDIDIMMYVALGMKHARLMVLLVCLSLMVGLVYYTYARPIYHSKALVRYDSLKRPVDTEKLFDDSHDRAVIKELSSPHIKERTARSLGIEAGRREISVRYVKKQTVKLNSERNIEIDVWPYSSELAKTWPEALVREYLLYRDERRLQTIKAKYQAIDEDMAQTRKRMDEAFNQKYDFRETNAFTKIVIELDRYKEIPRELLAVKTQLDLFDRTRESLGNASYDTVAKLALFAELERSVAATELNARQTLAQVNVGQTIPKEDVTSSVVVVPSMIASPLRKPWEGLDKERQGLQNQAQEIGKVYLSKHPKMVAIQKRLDEINRALQLELASERGRFDLQYAHLLEKEKELEAKLPAYDEITRRHQKYVNDYTHLDAGTLAWTAMYDRMSKQLTAFDFGADKERAELQYLGLLEVSEQPMSPNRLKLVIYFLLLGVALAIAVPYLIEYVDSRVSDVDQVEEALHIRSLGVVPKVTEAPLDTLLLPLPDVKTDHHVMENFRLIRTNLIMNSATPALPQVILVTSAMPQEGKTIVAAHLAMSFAKKGEKTLLVDADMRRGRLHRLFGCQNRPGLSEVLVQNAPFEEALHVVGNGNGNGSEEHAENGDGNGNGNGHLTLLPCGKHIHWASELLDSPVFPKLLDEFRQKYQRIIVDTPPVLGLSETAIIQRHADGVLLVIWSQFTPMRNVKTAIQTLQTNGAKFAGFVLNRLDFSSLTNRYKYFYYSPYYYHRYKAIGTPSSFAAK